MPFTLSDIHISCTFSPILSSGKSSQNTVGKLAFQLMSRGEEDAYKAGDIAELLSYHLTLIFSGVQVHLPVNPNEPRTRQQITDPDVKQIASKQLNGNVDLWSDNTDIEGLERVKLCYLYE